MKVKSKDILSNGNSAFKGAMVTLALLRNTQWVKGWNGRNKWYKMRSYGRSQTRLCKALQINAVRRLDFILSVVEATADSQGGKYPVRFTLKFFQLCGTALYVSSRPHFKCFFCQIFLPQLSRQSLSLLHLRLTSRSTLRYSRLNCGEQSDFIKPERFSCVNIRMAY